MSLFSLRFIDDPTLICLLPLSSLTVVSLHEVKVGAADEHNPLNMHAFHSSMPTWYLHVCVL